MKLITLNTWGGPIFQPLMDFISSKGAEVDIFCFQEVYHEADAASYDHPEDCYQLFNEFKKTLSSHEGYFHEYFKGDYGLGIFISKKLNLNSIDDHFVHKHKGFIPEGRLGHHARNIQIATFEKDDKKYNIINFHGLWNGQGKTDTEERLSQSQKIIEAMKKLEGEIIFCGDFNLLPDTESLKMFEDFGLRNLVKEYGITDTRTKLYEKSVRFADYIFVSKGVEVKDFKVLPDVVSDHAPLYIEFE